MRAGEDARIPKGDHRFAPVYNEMLRQIVRDYGSLPDPRELKANEIRFFYEGLRAELKAGTKPRR